MRRFKNILVIADCADKHNEAFERATHLARRNRALLTVACIIESLREADTLAAARHSADFRENRLQETMIQNHIRRLKILIAPLRDADESRLESIKQVSSKFYARTGGAQRPLRGPHLERFENINPGTRLSRGNMERMVSDIERDYVSWLDEFLREFLGQYATPGSFAAPGELSILTVKLSVFMTPVKMLESTHVA
jgi:hypothetical protein